MIYIVYTLHVIVCVFLILVVLLQQGKGADLSVFGGGSTQTAFGAVGATSLLHKLTVTSFVLFILTTMTIAVTQIGGESSVVSGVAAEQAAEQEAATPPPEGEAVVPETPSAGFTAAPEAEPEAAGETPQEEGEAPPPEGTDDSAGEGTGDESGSP